MMRLGPAVARSLAARVPRAVSTSNMFTAPPHPEPALIETAARETTTPSHTETQGATWSGGQYRGVNPGGHSIILSIDAARRLGVPESVIQAHVHRPVLQPEQGVPPQQRGT